MLYGYARVSTIDQKLDLQLDALASAGVPNANIYQEKLSGRLDQKPCLKSLVKQLGAGDTLVVYKLDRLGRSLAQLVSLEAELRRKEIGLRSIKEGVDTTGDIGSLIFGVLASFAQYEVSTIRSRVKDGLAAAKARGVVLGGKPKIQPKQWRVAQKMLASGITKQEIADYLGVSRKTLYNTIDRYKA